MSGELSMTIANILNEWNPLGDRASTTEGLEVYKYEAMDIISTIKITKSSVENAVSTVLTQAFGLTLNESDLKHYSARIEEQLNGR